MSTTQKYQTLDDFENALFGGKIDSSTMRHMGFINVSDPTRLSPGRFDLPEGQTIAKIFNKMKGGFNEN